MNAIQAFSQRHDPGRAVDPSQVEPRTGRLVDGFGRRFHYLRLSVTEVCNFRCAYCLPDGFRKTAPHSFLGVEEIARLANAFARLGVAKIRLTGGEPTVRGDIGEIIARVAATPGIDKVAMTTNGWNLHRHVAAWHAAGLTNLNISIDDLDAAGFAAITGHDRLDQVVAGLDAALALGMRAVKINAVLLKASAPESFDRFAAFVKARPIAVRFIELMRTGDNADYFAANHVSGAVLAAWLEARGWSARPRGFDDGPAMEYEHPDYLGRIGLIAPYGAGFCDSCNRLRVTARGKLRLCLFGEGGVDLRDLLADDRPDAVAERVTAALAGKSAGHRLHEGRPGDTRHLAQLGG
ncbi:GTP 3',8-cyclase MoaA [Sphingomonas oligophenolica]|uniref:GTP 3',8-cyclase n=1 Tax=Sphingomonas oligophenolica TaxID=301154 RepID=A0ABU9XZA0_9SPHN